MAGTTTGDDGNLGLGGGIGTAEDDFVFGVIGKRRIGDGEGVEGGVDEVGRV